MTEDKEDIPVARLTEVRPRLYLTAERIARLRAEVAGPRRKIWEEIRAVADRYVTTVPPAVPENRSQMRGFGNTIPWLALAYLMTEEEIYLQATKRWLLGVCGYESWAGLLPPPDLTAAPESLDTVDLGTGHLLYGVSLGYDWVYKRLTQEERKTVGEKLVEQAALMFDASAGQRLWWHDAYLQNHCYVDNYGLALAGLALYGEVPEATAWIGHVRGVFRRVFEALGEDGSSQEGLSYWGYGIETLLRYGEVARDLLGDDLYGSSWLRNGTMFFLYSVLPGFTRGNNVMSFGDCSRGMDGHGPAHILYRLAAEYRDGYAQWLAEEMRRREVGEGCFCAWLNLLWYDPEVAPKPPTDLPAFKRFTDLDLATMRSGWEDDGVMLGFRCGPFQPHGAMARFRRDLGGGHVHPDAGSFQIYAYGQWLAVDPGYTSQKRTDEHNTLLVDGVGQLGAGARWYDTAEVLRHRGMSRILKAERGPEVDYLIGDVGTVYRPEAGLKRFLRHVVYLKPDLFFIVDELEAERPVQFDWLLHGDESIQQKGERRFLVRKAGVGLYVHILCPEAFRWSIEGLEHQVRLKIWPEEKVQRTCFVSALQPRRLAEPRASVGPIRREEDTLTLEVERNGQIHRITMELGAQKLLVH